MPFLLNSFAGQVGFVACGIRNSKDAQIGDTFFYPHAPVPPLEGFKPTRPMVSLFPGVDIVKCEIKNGEEPRTLYK